MTSPAQLSRIGISPAAEIGRFHVENSGAQEWGDSHGKAWLSRSMKSGVNRGLEVGGAQCYAVKQAIEHPSSSTKQHKVLYHKAFQDGEHNALRYVTRP